MGTETVRHEEAGPLGAFFITRDDQRVGEMVYTRLDPSLIRIDHTEVAEVLRGQGAARQLLDALVAWARQTRTFVIAVCPYAKAQFAKDPSIRDVLAPGKT